VLANFFRAMPGELEEAALVDGATPFEAFTPDSPAARDARPRHHGPARLHRRLERVPFRVDLHLDRRLLGADRPAGDRLVLGRTQFEEPWGSIMAASVVVTVPLVVLVLVFQRQILAGLTSGAVKG
jgi:multiple sugar transport system permease protein